MRNPITTWLKRMSGHLGEGRLFSGRPKLSPLDLDRDWPDLERMMTQEEWPFLRADFEVSHAQPRSTSLIAQKDGQFAGFFTTHHFGDVGYLDMMVIPKRYRSAGIARPLYFSTLKKMRARGLRALVVHSTNDSARLLKLLGFEPGQDFTLLAHDSPVAARTELAGELVKRPALDALTALDAQIFGISRPSWQRALYEQPEVQFLGLQREGQLVASICLRPRRDRAICLDQVNQRSPDDLSCLLDLALERAAGRRVECFAKTGSALHGQLLARGFEVPQFFKPIGPLIEWRRGDTGRLGAGPHVQSLSWL